MITTKPYISYEDHIAEIEQLKSNHCKDCCCARSWKALGIKDNTGKSIPEHITELRGENAGLKEYSESRDESIKVYREEIKELKYTVEKYLRQIKLRDELIEKQKLGVSTMPKQGMTPEKGLRILAEWLEAKLPIISTKHYEFEEDLRGWATDFERLTKENERLRVALYEISLCSPYKQERIEHDSDVIKEMRKIAKEALKV